LLTATHCEPNPELALEVLDAIGRKAWEQLDRLTAPGIVVEVHAAPGIRTRRNEHVWRAVSVQGQAALMEYMQELHRAAPALAVHARSRARLEGHEVVRADCAGVDSAGSPFDAETDFAVWAEHGKVLRVEASVNGLAIGADVIRRGEGDPRKYFSAFLNEPRARHPRKRKNPRSWERGLFLELDGRDPVELLRSP
jgi:ketosteroid isomerase-like protein